MITTMTGTDVTYLYQNTGEERGDWKSPGPLECHYRFNEQAACFKTGPVERQDCRHPPVRLYLRSHTLTTGRFYRSIRNTPVFLLLGAIRRIKNFSMRSLFWERVKKYLPSDSFRHHSRTGCIESIAVYRLGNLIRRKNGSPVSVGSRGEYRIPPDQR